MFGESSNHLIVQVSQFGAPAGFSSQCVVHEEQQSFTNSIPPLLDITVSVIDFGTFAASENRH